VKGEAGVPSRPFGILSGPRGTAKSPRGGRRISQMGYFFETFFLANFAELR
jgi:hypothetical protein